MEIRGPEAVFDSWEVWLSYRKIQQAAWFPSKIINRVEIKSATHVILAKTTNNI